MMATKIVLILSCLIYLTECDALQEAHQVEEARGKKKKIALFVFFADLVIKKIFVLKLIYAFVFWLVIHKAGYFLGWFVSYLKEQKKHQCHSDHDHHYEYNHEYEPYKKASYDGHVFR